LSEAEASAEGISEETKLAAAGRGEMLEYFAIIRRNGASVTSAIGATAMIGFWIVCQKCMAVQY